MCKQTQIIEINPDSIDVNILDKACHILNQGGIVAFPTETVYGLGVNAMDAEAANKVYTAKGRPSDNPLIVHISSIQEVYQIAENVSDQAEKLMETFWPGPITLIFKKKKLVPNAVTGGLDTVAVRMPNHPIALALMQRTNMMLAAPSANTSGKPSPTLAGHVIEDLMGKVDMIIDGGRAGLGIESTIVDMTVSPPAVLRPGFVNKEMLTRTIGKIDEEKQDKSNANIKARAPGMKYRHYAPQAPIVVYDGNFVNVIEAISNEAKRNVNNGIKIGIIASAETADRYSNGIVKMIGSRQNEKQIAGNLFRILREFDKEKVDYIYSESFSTPELGTAIMNRLLKAASYQVKRV